MSEATASHDSMDYEMTSGETTSDVAMTDAPLLDAAMVQDRSSEALKREGEPMSGTAKKPKAEYSEHPNAVRERERIAGLSEDKAAANRERKARNERHRRARKSAQATHGFDSLSKEEQKSLEAEYIAANDAKHYGVVASHARIASTMQRPVPGTPAAFSAELDNEMQPEHTPDQDSAEQRQENLLSPADLLQMNKSVRMGKSWSLYYHHWRAVQVVFVEKLELMADLEAVDVLDDAGAVIARRLKINKAFIGLIRLAIDRRRTPGGRPDMTYTNPRFEINQAPWFLLRKKYYRVACRREDSDEVVDCTTTAPRSSRPVVLTVRKDPSHTLPEGEERQQVEVLEELLRLEATGGPLLPHMLFTAAERSLFRNVMSWDPEFVAGVQTTLPGPSWLWPEKYDFSTHGLEPVDDPSQAERLYLMVARGSEEKVPNDFEKVLDDNLDMRFKETDEAKDFEMKTMMDMFRRL
nr:hypothetical protein B0A51_09721 [Rachicladosporium sp. CCFEE 5018]